MSDHVTGNTMTNYRSLFDLQLPPQQEYDEEAIPSFEQPLRPDPTLIDLIHREHNGLVAIDRRRSPAEQEEFRRSGKKGSIEWETLAALPARRLAGFEQMVSELEVDGYASINGMRQGRRWPNGRGYVDADGSPLAAGWKAKHNVEYLNACWVDLDCHNLGLSIGQVVGTVIDAEAAGRIPRPSVLIDSGRGCWVMWLVRGRNGAINERNTPQTLPLWEAIQGKIDHTFRQLGADAKAKDAARICRIAGSINSKVGRRVSYFPWYNEKGLIATYELDRLALGFGIDPVKVPPTLKELPPVALARLLAPSTKPKSAVANSPQQTPPEDTPHKNPTKKRAGIAGHVKRWNNERERFYKLLRHRHRIQIGDRNAAVSVLSIILRKLGYDLQAAATEVANDLFPYLEQTGGESYPLDSALRTVRSTFASSKQGSPSHVKIGDWLNVTPEESKTVGWPPVGTQPVEPQQPKGRDEQRRRRLEHLAAIIVANSGEVPGYGSLVNALKKAGYPSCRTSVKRDLAAIGFSNPRSRDDEAPRLF